MLPDTSHDGNKHNRYLISSILECCTKKGGDVKIMRIMLRPMVLKKKRKREKKSQTLEFVYVINSPLFQATSHLGEHWLMFGLLSGSHVSLSC